MNNIYNYTYDELMEYFLSIEDRKFRATQIYEWLYRKRVDDFSKMKNVKRELIERMKEDFSIDKIKIVDVQKGEDVAKYLFELTDGHYIEAVLMIHDYGNSLCVSSQVGCNMGCKFCESGRLKKVRNLETYEMVQQILYVEEDLKERVSHVVLMGIGEPFDNYKNVMNFIKIINYPKGIAIGARHITVSTCGIVSRIKMFTKENIQANLAISFHAPNDKLRKQIMPINKVYKIDDIIESVKEYIEKTNRKVTFEYIMLDEVNDSKECALELAHILKGMNCYVNLIPYNETKNNKFKRSKEKTILAFYDILKKNNINVTIRKEFGSLIDAACGQLRAKKMEE